MDGDSLVLSEETLLLFQELLDGIQLQMPPTHPDFKAKALALIKAQEELTAALRKEAQQ